MSVVISVSAMEAEHMNYLMANRLISSDTADGISVGN